MLYIVLSLLLFLAQAHASGSNHCSDNALQEARVFIDSEDVGDGKWQSQVVVERESDKNATADTASGRLLTDVQHSIADCGDTTKLRVVISFTVTDKTGLQLPVTPPKRGRLSRMKPKAVTNESVTPETVKPETVKPETVKPETVVKPQVVIPQGYHSYPGFGAYKMYPIGKTYPVARATCEAEGAHLVIINSAEEHGVVQRVAAKYSTFYGATTPDWFWTGVYENGVNGRYVTVKGEPFSSTGFTTLHRSDLHRNGNDAYTVSRHFYGFADGKTNLPWAFMCEIDL